jgi:hypothetical protein
LTNEGEWVVAGGRRKPSGAGGESFQRGLEWRRALCKPFLDREGLGLILFFNIESTPALSSSLGCPIFPFYFLFKLIIGIGLSYVEKKIFPEDEKQTKIFTPPPHH